MIAHSSAASSTGLPYHPPSRHMPTPGNTSIHQDTPRLIARAFVGGLPESEDRDWLRSRPCHIVVGTPGRLRALIDSGALSTSGTRMLVLDEADSLMDASMSYMEDVSAIVGRLPARKQVMAFSATYTDALLSRVSALMRDPHRIMMGAPVGGTTGGAVTASASCHDGGHQGQGEEGVALRGASEDAAAEGGAKAMTKLEALTERLSFEPAGHDGSPTLGSSDAKGNGGCDASSQPAEELSAVALADDAVLSKGISAGPSCNPETVDSPPGHDHSVRDDDGDSSLYGGAIGQLSRREAPRVMATPQHVSSDTVAAGSLATAADAADASIASVGEPSAGSMSSEGASGGHATEAGLNEDQISRGAEGGAGGQARVTAPAPARYSDHDSKRDQGGDGGGAMTGAAEEEENGHALPLNAAALMGVQQYFYVVETPSVAAGSGGGGDEDNPAAAVSSSGNMDMGRTGAVGGGKEPPLVKQAAAASDLVGIAKVEALISLLECLPFHQAIVFCNHVGRAKRAAAALSASGFPSAFTHGGHKQADRMATVAAMRAFRLRVLVSTDLTARGVDFDHVNVVVNLDLPRDSATYLHRVGRTGRFGTQGLAVTYVSGDEVRALASLKEEHQLVIDPLPPRRQLAGLLDRYELAEEREREAFTLLVTEKSEGWGKDARAASHTKNTYNKSAQQNGDRSKDPKGVRQQQRREALRGPELSRKKPSESVQASSHRSPAPQQMPASGRGYHGEQVSSGPTNGLPVWGLPGGAQGEAVDLHLPVNGFQGDGMSTRPGGQVQEGEGEGVEPQEGMQWQTGMGKAGQVRADHWKATMQRRIPSHSPDFPTMPRNVADGRGGLPQHAEPGQGPGFSLRPHPQGWEQELWEGPQPEYLEWQQQQPQQATQRETQQAVLRQRQRQHKAGAASDEPRQGSQHAPPRLREGAPLRRPPVATQGQLRSASKKHESTTSYAQLPGSRMQDAPAGYFGADHGSGVAYGGIFGAESRPPPYGLEYGDGLVEPPVHGMEFDAWLRPLPRYPAQVPAWPPADEPPVGRRPPMAGMPPWTPPVQAPGWPAEYDPYRNYDHGGEYEATNFRPAPSMQYPAGMWPENQAALRPRALYARYSGQGADPYAGQQPWPEGWNG
eukprot:jgi/Mesvir1/992/Mv17533-RA.2